MAKPPVRKGRSTTKCVLMAKKTKQTEKVAELPPAINDAAWMERLQAVRNDVDLPKPRRGPRVGDVHPYVRKQIKKVLPALCDTFLDKAIDGDLSTMKLLWQMAELDKQSETAGNRANDRKFVRQAIAKFRKR